MILQLLGTTALVAALPKKTAFIGEALAEGRISLVGAARSGIDALVEHGAISPKEATDAKKNLMALRRRADGGWSSSEEYGAAGSIVSMLAVGTIEIGRKAITDALS